jgi:hypothetical protein
MAGAYGGEHGAPSRRRLRRSSRALTGRRRTRPACTDHIDSPWSNRNPHMLNRILLRGWVIAVRRRPEDNGGGLMAVNRYPGRCSACGHQVSSGGGTLTRSGDRWIVRHIDCADVKAAPQRSAEGRVKPSGTRQYPAVRRPAGKPGPKPGTLTALQRRRQRVARWQLLGVLSVIGVFGWTVIDSSEAPSRPPSSTLTFAPFDGDVGGSRSCGAGTYTNVDGNCISGPVDSPSGPPPGASARCGDGTYSFSQHRSGTCSHHGGVATWNP